MFTVLHVDNSSFFNKIVKECIEKIGFHFISANDISRAVFELENHSIDLIITGLEIKGGGGEYFIRQLNSGKYRDIPVIIMTSNDSMATRMSMFRLGVIDYIAKDKTFRKRLFMFLRKLTEKDRAKRILQKMKIAVLDDSKTQLQVIKNILSLNKMEKIDYYSDPMQLVETEKRYQIYLLDVVMPGLSGEQVILHLKKKYPDSLIIAISGVDNYKVVSNILLSGADDYMLKPFNASIFMARLVSNVRMYMLVQELKKKNRELEFSLITDPQTKIYNKHYMYKTIEDEVAKARQTGSHFSLLLLSIDNFEYINDSYGHDTGDQVILKIAAVLKQEIDDHNTIGRFAGVEFIVMFPGIPPEEAYKKSESIRKRVASLKIEKHSLSVSGGFSELTDESAQDLIKMVDSLLFNAKKLGKNRIEQGFNWDEYVTVIEHE